MSTALLVAPLRRVALFQGLRPLQISEIARRAERIVYRDGDVIAESGKEADAAILIVDGHAIRTAGPELGSPMEPVSAGALIAEMAMMVETEHTSTIVARTSVKALRLTRVALLGQLADDPDLGEHLVAVISGRLRALADELRRIDQTLGVADDAESLLLPPAAVAHGAPPRLLPLAASPTRH
jgi:CRP-like cAMP-binding protein